MRVARGSALCLLVLASLESAFGEPDAAVEAEELDLADLESDEDDGGEAEGEAEDFDKDMPMEVRLVRMKVCLAGASARLHSNAEAVAKLAEELVESRPGISKEQATNSVFFTWMMTCYMNIGEERAQQAADGDAEVLKDLRLYEPNPENVYNAQSASRSQWSFLIDVVKEHVADQEAALKAQEKAQRSSSGSSGSSNSGQMPPVQEPPTPSAGNKASILLLAVVFGIIGLATMFLMRKEKEEQERRKAKKEKKKHH